MYDLLGTKLRELPIILDCLYQDIYQDIALGKMIKEDIKPEEAVIFAGLDDLSMRIFFVWSGIWQIMRTDDYFWPANLLSPTRIEELKEILGGEDSEPTTALLLFVKLCRKVDEMGLAEAKQVFSDLHQAGAYAIKRAIDQEQKNFWWPKP